jgi:hypothetical protein
MNKLLISLTALGAFFLAQAASAAIVVNTDSSGNPASCGETQGGNTLNIGTPNTAVSIGDVLILVVGIAANPSYAITSITNQAGVTPWVSARAVSQIFDSHGGRAYIEIARATAAFTNGVGATITTSTANTFVGGCMMDVAGLKGIIDQQAGLDSAAGIGGSNITPTLFNQTASEFALAVSNCQYTLNLSNPIDPPWTSIGYNGAGGCPAGFRITSSPGPQSAALNQYTNGSAAVGIVLVK